MFIVSLVHSNYQPGASESGPGSAPWHHHLMTQW